MQKNNYQSIRVFENPILERFTHVHPLTPLIVWLPVALYFLYQGFTRPENNIVNIFLFGLLGLLVWTIVEYVMHRFIFHFPAKSNWGKRLIFIFHGLHHDDAKDPTRLLMPPVPALIYIFLFYQLFNLFIPKEYLSIFFGFFLIGYLLYDYIHFGTHHFTPKTKVGKFLRKHHLLHHTSYPHAKYGVSSPLWDYIFKTIR